MFRHCLKNTPRLMLLIPGVFNNSADKPVSEETLDPGHIGVDRVINVFKRQENGTLSPEFERINYSIIFSMIGGGFVGSVMSMLGVVRRYKEENVVTQYETHFRGSRALQTKVFWEFLKGFYSISWRTGLFVGVFQTTATMLYAYDGTMRVDHYAIAGAVTGACYQLPKGFKPAFSGLVFGCLFGSIAGLAIKGILYTTGYTLSDIYDARRMTLEKYQLEQLKQNTDRVTSEAKRLHEELASLKE